jgi:uncharacterized protein (TIGR00251 family)
LRGLVLEVHVQPGARRDEVVGEHGGRLKIKLAAPPVDGKANRHLLEFLAAAFAVPVARVHLLRGASSRMKTVLVEGASELPATFAT